MRLSPSRASSPPTRPPTTPKMPLLQPLRLQADVHARQEAPVAVTMRPSQILQESALDDLVEPRSRIRNRWRILQHLANALHLPLPFLRPSQILQGAVGDEMQKNRRSSPSLPLQRLQLGWIGFLRVEVLLGIPDPLSATSHDLKVRSQSLGAACFRIKATASAAAHLDQQFQSLSKRSRLQLLVKSQRDQIRLQTPPELPQGVSSRPRGLPASPGGVQMSPHLSAPYMSISAPTPLQLTPRVRLRRLLPLQCSEKDIASSGIRTPISQLSFLLASSAPPALLLHSFLTAKVSPNVLLLSMCPRDGSVNAPSVKSFSFLLSYSSLSVYLIVLRSRVSLFSLSFSTALALALFTFFTHLPVATPL